MNLKRFAKWDGVNRFHGYVCKKGSKVLVCVFESTILSSALVQFSKRWVNYLITQLYSGSSVTSWRNDRFDTLILDFAPSWAAINSTGSGNLVCVRCLCHFSGKVTCGSLKDRDPPSKQQATWAGCIQPMSRHPAQLRRPRLLLVIYLLGVRGRFQGAAIVLGVHHGHVRAAVVQHLLHAVHAAALAACADRGTGDWLVAPQAVHLTTGCLAVLQHMNMES